MEQTKHRFSKEVKIGIVTIIGLTLLYVGVNYLKGINLFNPSNHYYVTFTNVRDLTVSSPVYVEGFKVGLVRSMAYDYSTTNRITVEISLEDEMQINRGSYITIVKGLLSGAELHMHLNKEATDYLLSGEVMEGRTEEDVMTSIQGKVIPGIADLLPKLDSILTGLQTLVQHPALAQSLVHIERTSGNLETATHELNRLLHKDVPVIVGNLTATTANLNEVSVRLKDLDLASTMQAVNATLANLRETTAKLNATDNSLGLLLNDKSLYENMNSASENATKLLFDLREHPKRYVHFSLF